MLCLQKQMLTTLFTFVNTDTFVTTIFLVKCICNKYTLGLSFIYRATQYHHCRNAMEIGYTLQKKKC